MQRIIFWGMRYLGIAIFSLLLQRELRDKITVIQNGHCGSALISFLRCEHDSRVFVTLHSWCVCQSGPANSFVTSGGGGEGIRTLGDYVNRPGLNRPCPAIFRWTRVRASPFVFSCVYSPRREKLGRTRWEVVKTGTPHI